MSEFEELRLTVSLTDNASAGLQRLRAEIGQLTTTTRAMAGGFAGSTTALNNFGNVSQTAAPQMRSANAQMRDLTRAAQDTSRSVIQMGMIAKQGLGSMPQLAIVMWDAARGVNQLAQGLAIVSPSARVATLALGGIALGVAAIGAAAIAYGVSVFRMAKEMDQLDKTSKTLGMSFATLKGAQDQAKAAGELAEVVTRNFQGIQAAQLNLFNRNSELRNKLLVNGVGEEWIKAFSTADPRQAFNMIRSFAKRMEKNLIDSGWTESAAKGMAEQFGQEFGVSIGELPELKPLSPEAVADMEKIKTLSAEVMGVWNPLSLKLERLELEGLKVGLPYLVDILSHTDVIIKRVQFELHETVAVFKAIKFVFDVIAHPIDTIGRMSHDKELNDKFSDRLFGKKGEQFRDWLEWIKRHTRGSGKANDSGAKDVILPLGFGNIGPGGGRSDGSLPKSWGHNDVWDSFRKSSNIEDRRDESGNEDNVTQTGALTAQLERLNNYFDRIEARQAGGGGGGGGGRGGGGGGGGFGLFSGGTGGSGGGFGGGGSGNSGGNSGGGNSGGNGVGNRGNGAAPAPAETSDQTTPADTTTYTGGSGRAADRAPLMEEVNKDPATKKLMHQMMDTEGGGAATVEALFNRTAMIRKKIPGYSIKDELNSGFYGPIKKGIAQRRNISSATAAQYDKSIATVVAGSDITKGRTDQGSGSDPNVTGPGRIPVPGSNEVYNYWQGRRKGVEFSYKDSAAYAAGPLGTPGTPSTASAAPKAGPSNIPQLASRADIIDASKDVGRLNYGGPMAHPEGLLVHHTGGREGSPQALANALRSRTDIMPGGLSVQYFIGRDNKIYQMTPAGVQAWHAGKLEKSLGIAGKDLGNQNVLGVEVAAKGEKDILPGQRAAIAKLYKVLEAQYGWKSGSLWGHGELTSRKEGDEGATARMIREGRIKLPDDDKTAIATATAGENTNKGQGPTVNRAALDRAATTEASKPTINGGMKTEVEAPAGTKVTVEGGGAFKKNETTRSTTMSKETANKLMATN